MKTRKEKNKKGNELKSQDGVYQRSISQHKVKYRHQNHWLEEDDGDYLFPKYKDEEE